MRKKKKIIIFFLLLLFICIVCFIFKDKIINHIVPIYKIEDRSENVKKLQKSEGNLVIGWIKVQGTDIDYPIMYEETIEFSRKYDFVWMNNYIYKDTNFIPIFGHNIRNVSSKPIIGDKNMKRFEQLMSFIYYKFNENNKYIQLTVDGKNYLYEIFSVSLFDKGETEYYTQSYSKKELQEYIDKSLKDSYFKFDVDVNSNDKILSLITCTRFDGELSNNFKVDAKLVKNKNKGYNYGIQKKKVYTKVEKILEGDGDNV